MLKVSVIVPNYNHALFLEERLTSIFNQTFQDFEVILLDDASTDNSVSILETYSQHPNFSKLIINQNNSGSPFKQWKKGIELAKGEYIWIAESDDTCDINFLDEQVKLLRDYDIAVSKTLILSNGEKTNETLDDHFYSSCQTNLLEAKHFINYCPIGNASAVLFKKNLIKSYDFSYCSIIGDMVFYFDNFKGHSIIYNQKTHNYFRRKKEGLSNLSKKGFSYYKKYFQEHATLLQRINKQVDDKNKVQKRLTQRFNKVRNRLSFQQKLQFGYLKLYFSYLNNKKSL